MYTSTAVGNRKHAVASFVLLACLLACVVAMPLLAIPAALVLPVFLCPAYLAGRLWISLLTPVVPFAALLTAGWDIGLCLCLPAYSYFCLLIQVLSRKSKHFSNASAVWFIAVMAGVQTLWWGRVSMLLGGNMYARLSAQIIENLAQSPYCDGVLSSLVRGGVLVLPAKYQQTVSFLQRTLLSAPLVRGYLLDELRFFLQDYFISIIPGLLAQISVLVGVAITLQTMREEIRINPLQVVTLVKEGQQQRVVHTARFQPRFRDIRIPKAYRGHMLLLAAGSLLLWGGAQGAVLFVMGRLMQGVFSTVYALLGAATLVALSGKDRMVRTVLCGAFALMLFVLYPTVLVMLGLADQFWGLRPIPKIYLEEEE